MPLLTGWPTVTDDLGDKISGTIFNQALTNAIKVSIEANINSGSNPGITAGNIIDEVVTARGALATLAGRLAVFLNNDGTPKATPYPGQVTGTWSGGVATVIAQNSVTAGNGADTTEDNLAGYTLNIPANAMLVDGQSLEFHAYGLLANNADTKTLRLDFAGTKVVLLSDATATAGRIFILHMVLMRHSATLVTARGTISYGPAATPPATINVISLTASSTADFTISQTVKLTAQASVANANDLQVGEWLVTLKRL